MSKKHQKIFYNEENMKDCGCCDWSRINTFFRLFTCILWCCKCGRTITVKGPLSQKTLLHNAVKHWNQYVQEVPVYHYPGDPYPLGPYEEVSEEEGEKVKARNKRTIVCLKRQSP